MTIEGAIADLQNLIDSEGIPFWAKPSLQKVKETVEAERERHIEERKTGEWCEEDVDSVLASIRTDCKQKINCDGCRFNRGDSAMCGIWGLPSNWAVEMEGAEE